LFKDSAWMIACKVNKNYEIIQKKTCHVTDMKIWSELNSSTWKNKSCQSCNNIQEKSSESSICEFLKIEWFNIREFIKLKANTIDWDSIEYNENEIREVQQLIVSQIFKNYLRFQIDFRVSWKNDIQWCLDSARKKSTTEDIIQQRSNADLRVLRNEKDKRHSLIFTANLNSITWCMTSIWLFNL